MAEKKKTSRGTSDGILVQNAKPMERSKPSITVTEDDLPQIKDWSVGKKYNVKAHVEMRSHSAGDSYGYDEKGKKKHEARLIFHSISSDGDEE